MPTGELNGENSGRPTERCKKKKADSKEALHKQEWSL